MGANFNGALGGPLGQQIGDALYKVSNSPAAQGKVWSETQGQWVEPGPNSGAMPSSDISMLIQNGTSNPLQNSQYGYNQFPLTPTTSTPTNYNSAFNIASGDSDYTKAAKVQAQGNLAAAQQATAANRVNQINPYGSIQYYQSGTDASGNPVWSAASSLAPEQQALLNLQNQQSLQSGNIASNLLNNAQGILGQPLSTANLPALQGNIAAQQLQTGISGTGMEGWDKATQLINQRLQPQIQQSNERLKADLANQGIAPGTEAYNRAMTQQGQQVNDLLTQAQLQGASLQNQMFGQNLAAGQFGNQALQQSYQNQLASANLANQARSQGLSEQQLMQNQPLNIINALRQGSQVQNPSFIGAPQQATTSGPDTLSAYQAQQNAALAQQNAANAQKSNLTSGLFDLGGSLLGNIGGVANTVGNIGSGVVKAVSNIGSSIGNIFSGWSDIRMKENIRSVGTMPNGLNIYEYEFKPEFKDIAGHGKQIGVMAQEVAQIIPEAVSMQDNGYMMVDYGKLQ
jgi:hypothetical protein